MPDLSLHSSWTLSKTFNLSKASVFPYVKGAKNRNNLTELLLRFNEHFKCILKVKVKVKSSVLSDSLRPHGQ